LDHYEIVIVGANLGGIFSRQFDKVTKGKFPKAMLINKDTSNPLGSLRMLYEQQRANKSDYTPNGKLAINNMYAMSDNVSLK
jgi:hypothetical protein